MRALKGNATNSEVILTHWRQERSVRIGRVLGLIGTLLAAISAVADFAYEEYWLLPTDLLLVAGCLLSWHWARSARHAGHFWWPLYLSYFAASLPMYWTTGGLSSPFFGIGVALLYVIAEVLDSRGRSRLHMSVSALHIPAFWIAGMYFTAPNAGMLPPLFIAITTSLNLAAVFFCVRAFLRTDAELALEFSHRQEEINDAQSIAKVGSWSWNIDDDTITWSDELFRMFGIDKKDFDPSYKAYLARLSPAQREYIDGLIDESARTGKDFMFEHAVPGEGETRTIFARGRVVKDASGRTVGMVGTSQDITERKKIEAELLSAREELERRVEERTVQLEQSLAREKAAKEQAERASQAKMQFLANMSHEIRTPMNSILGFSEILSSADYSPAKTREFVERIRANGGQLLRLIDDILDLSKFEAGHIPIEKSPVQVHALLDDVAGTFQPALKAKNLRLEISTAPDLPSTISLDETRIRQVLVNLISNAIKFSEMGTIRVKAEAVRRRLIVHVEDMGIGISAENQKSLFQLFSQGDSSVARKFGGSGLGLALSKRIAEAMGGSLELKFSERGRGSSFAFEVPFETASVARAGGAAGAGAAAGAAAEGGPLDAEPAEKKILLAEDSADNAFLISHFIKPLGYAVDLVTDGLQAVEAAGRKRYDCILMDIQMPGMDGLEATRRIRAAGYTAPIIALTAHALPAEAERSLAAGCNLHLTKPISSADLKNALSAQLEGTL